MPARLAFVASANAKSDGDQRLLVVLRARCAQLLDARDLQPTLDIRRLIAPVLQRQFAFSTADLQASLPDAPRGLDGIFNA